MTKVTSWLDISPESDFSLHNLPFGIFSTEAQPHKRVGVAIGDQVIDLHALATAGAWPHLDGSVFAQPSLNAFIALGKEKTSALRLNLQQWLTDEGSLLGKNRDALLPMSEVTLHMPVAVGDYTDFYSSIEHATNVGRMFRDPENALLPNWRHLPVGYHGRASSIRTQWDRLSSPQRTTHAQRCLNRLSIGFWTH